VQGRCQCDTGWVGTICDQSTSNTTLVDGIPAPSSRVSGGNWVYYQYTLTNSSQINIVLRETSTQGMVWLYVSAGHFPDNSVFDAVDTSPTTSLKHIHLEFSVPKLQAVYYIGVYGSPLIVAGNVNFQLVVWATPF